MPTGRPYAEPAVRGLFVTGTDTGVGKSVVAAAVCAALAAEGRRVAAFKPVVSGLEESTGKWPHDHELLASFATAGQTPNEVAPHRFGPSASPHLAAQLAGARIDPADLVERARAAASGAHALVCEGVGGLMVPLTEHYLVLDLARDLELPLVVVARPGLGTINHTLLTVESARASGLRVAGVVFTPWPPEPSAVEVSNRATVERLAGVRVSAFGHVEPANLAHEGSRLPVDCWLEGMRPR